MKTGKDSRIAERTVQGREQATYLFNEYYEAPHVNLSALESLGHTHIPRIPSSQALATACSGSNSYVGVREGLESASLSRFLLQNFFDDVFPVQELQS